MTQDTRKDRRVKIVSLNVRYKSATVDEFIENHAHDVSRGGIYIKTGNPFPVGTLLKFEIRLAADQPVITGVGRVVWKRDSTPAASDSPSGMGVKFIKVDDPSKIVIDRLVTSRSDAGRAFEQEAGSSPRASQRPPEGSIRPGAPGKGATPSTPPVRRKPTPYPGVSAVVSTPPASTRSAAPPVFPRSGPDAGGVGKQEPTVMKQAAELLEEALREAGGSMDEVEANPLFAKPSEAQSRKPSVKPPPTATAQPTADKPLRPSIAASKEATVAHGMVAALSPGPARTPKAESAKPAAPAEKRSSRGPVIAVAAVLVVGGLVVLNRDKLFGASAAPEPGPSSAPSAVASDQPAPPPAASATASAAAPADSVAQAGATVDAGSIPETAPSAAHAQAAVAAPAVVSPPPAPKPVSPPPEAPAAAPKPAPAAVATATESPKPEPSHEAPSASAEPTATAAPVHETPSGTASSAPSAAAVVAKPAPAGKPAKASDDNPY